MAVERFNIHIAKDVLDDLKYRLDHIRWPDQLEDSTWQRGTEKGYLSDPRNLTGKSGLI
jgi:Epoxide hydrolase N terminus